MKKATVFIVFGLLTCSVASLSIAGCHRSPAQTTSTSSPPKPVSSKVSRPRNAKDLLGTSTVAILRRATRVDTFRVENGQPKSGQAVVAGFPVVYKGKPQGKVFTSRLARLLLDDKSYFAAGQFNPRRKCSFEPFAAYRLWAKRQIVEVCLCFHCREWSIVTKDAGGKTIHRAFGSFEGAKSELVSLTQEAFPRDKEVRRLDQDE